MTLTKDVRAPAPQSRESREAGEILRWRVVVLFGALGVWYLVHLMGIFPPGLLPSPIGVAGEWFSAVLSADYWTVLGQTLLGAVVGLAIGALVGIPVGILTGRFVAADLSLRFLIDFGRAFPAIALVAVLVLMLGTGIEIKVVLVFFAVVFIMILQTQHGVRSVASSIVDTTQAFQIHGGLFVRKVLVPSAAPSIMAGLRLAASVAVLVTIGVEVLTGAPGLGARIGEAQVGGNAQLSYAYIGTAGILGYLVNFVLGRLQARVLRWQPAGSED